MKNQAIRILFTLLMSTGLLFVSCKKDDNSPTKASNLYFTAYNDNLVGKVDLNLAPPSKNTLFSGSDGITTPEGISLTKDGYLIVAEESNNRIVKMKKDGTGDVVALYDSTDGVNTPTALALDNSTGNLYWCNSGTGQVLRGTVTGSAPPVPLYGGQVVLAYAYGLAIDKKNNKLFISDFEQYIKSGNLDGTGTPAIVWDNVKYTSMMSPSNIYLDADAGKIYWCDESANEVVEANLDGTGSPVVLFDNSDGVDRPDGVFVDKAAKRIYWTETNANVIARGNLDGTGERQVLITNTISYAILLE